MATIFFFWKKNLVEKYCIDKFLWNLVHSLHIIIKSISLLHTLEYWKPSLMVALISSILVFEIFPVPIILCLTCYSHIWWSLYWNWCIRTIGDWLHAGTAESFLKASHVTRTRHVHQVTACSWHIWMHKAYRQYLDEAVETETLRFPDWKVMREIESPLFHFWSLTLNLELIILISVRSLSERNFTLYKNSLTMLIPWFLR